LEAQGTGFQATGRGFHVLVVDDDKDTAESLCALLRIWGYQCQACYEIEAGLRAACELHPDCLVVDIDTPGLVGQTLAQELRIQPGFDRVILVALTFNSDAAHVQCSQEAGFDFHLVKPMVEVQIKWLRRLMDSLNEQVQLAGKTTELAR
jgi:CheY-like chemotaxis protein